MELGLAGLDAGHREGIGHLRAALPEVTDPFRRAVVAAAAAAATARHGDPARAVEILDRAIDSIAERELLLHLEAHRALAGRSDLSTLDGARARLHGQAEALSGETPGERRLWRSRRSSIRRAARRRLGGRGPVRRAVAAGLAWANASSSRKVSR